MVRFRGYHDHVALAHQNFCRSVEIVLDETLGWRWGRKIKKRGHWRDCLASSRKQNVTTGGLRWLVAALSVKLPWSSRGYHIGKILGRFAGHAVKEFKQTPPFLGQLTG